MATTTISRPRVFRQPIQPIRAAAKTTVFLLKLLPMLPSRALNSVTTAPVVERLRYPTHRGQAEGDLYRPASAGPHPGVVVCLGVVPFGVDHPQVPRLGEALARAGFAALLYWSPAMRDLRLDPEDSEHIALAYQSLVEQPYVDPARSGLLGACVGGSFALMAAASPRIRDRVAFVYAFAPYSSLWTLAQDIASATRSNGGERLPWPVDQLTRKVFVRTFTDGLAPSEAAWLRETCAERNGAVECGELSASGRAVYRLLSELDVDEAQSALSRLPSEMHERLTAMSPMTYLEHIQAPVITVGHDRDDLVIPVGESRRLWAALSGRAGAQYTEYAMFQHADPTKRRLSPFRLAWELGRFYRSIYPVFRCAAAA